VFLSHLFGLIFVPVLGGVSLRHSEMNVLVWM